MKYVALLRGINVGGNRKVPMAELRHVFENRGFADVSTYINSGNVIFSAGIVPRVTDIERAIAKHFGFAVETLVISQAKLASVAKAIPDEWTNDTEQKSDVVFLFPDIDKPDILSTVGYNPAVESMIYLPGVIITNISRNNQPKSSLLKLVGTPLYQRMTIRNVNTVRKLAELAR
ncbi:MAG: DUF1697 domain-containing protein [Candidatus Saccharimonadales bacterium]|nr:DUF1697 domain-containing protein [Candidatus Saccharimonas sp.]